MGLFSGKKRSEGQPERRTARVADSARPSYIYYSNRQAHPISAEQGVADRSRTSQQERTTGSRKQRKRGVIFWVIVVAGVILVAQLTMLNGSSAVVQLQTADYVSGTIDTKVYEKSVSAAMRHSILNYSKITVDAHGIASELRREHPEIEKAVVTVPLVGNKITVYVAQSEPTFILQSKGSYYTLGASGYITSKVQGQPQLPVISDETGEKVAVGMQLLPASHVKFMQTVYYQLSQTDLDVQSLLLPAKRAYEVDVRIKNKPYLIRFNFEEDPLQQSGSAVATLQQLGTATPGQYLDVRVPGRVYYR